MEIIIVMKVINTIIKNFDLQKRYMIKSIKYYKNNNSKNYISQM